MTTTSDRYLHIDTDTYVSTVTDVLKQRGLSYSIRRLGTGKRTRNTRHTYEVKIDGLNFNDPTGSPLVPVAFLTNSYRGECSFTVETGWYRKVCSNGLMMAQSEQRVGRVRHVKGKNEERLKQLQYELVAWLDGLQEQLAQLSRLATVPVSYESGLTAIKGLGLAGRTAEAVELAWRVPMRSEDRGHNLYTLWQTVNEQLRLRSRTEAGALGRERGLIDKLTELVAA